MLITTVAARNYLAHARVLSRSFLDHHPDGRVSVLVVDAPPSGLAEPEPFDLITPADLSLDRRELMRMAAMYDVTELSTALKPLLLEHLLVDRREPSVTYLDPDIEVFAPLDDIDELARLYGIVLTPHRLEPLVDDGRQPVEQVLVQAGAYNLGFISVSTAALPFLNWWSGHCRRDCVVAFDEGLFVDQRWVDLGAVYFEPHVLRDPGVDVAYWNLDHRPVLATDSGFEAGGAPLRLFHFSAFDPDMPHILSRHQGRRPRVLLSDQPALRTLCTRYAARLRDEGRLDECSTLPYGWGLAANGMPIDGLMRRIYRQEILRRERGTDEERGDVEAVGDPFDPDRVDAFVALLRSPFPGSDRPRIPRYLHALHQSRADLQAGFPDLRGSAGNHFLWWVREMGHAELDIPPELVPSVDDLEPPDGGPRPRRQGVRVVGYLTAELGIGEAGRSMVAALEALDEPYSVAVEKGTANRLRHPLPEHSRPVEEAAEFDVNLLHVNADRLPVVCDRLGDHFLRDRWNIGFWAWEVEEFPSWMARAAQLVDEIWTPSEHSSRAIRAAVDKPVHTIPHPVVAIRPSPVDRRALHLPDGFVFLFSFDFYSVAERKNPVGLIDAFCRAFAPGEGPQLVLKSINGAASLVELERVRLRALGRPDVHILDGYLDPPDTRALMKCCDAYISLHRAEGFGLTLAEAMAAGKPAIATGYSGNLEFMDETNGFLVDYSMTAIPAGCEPYPMSARWADPDLDHAAELMRRVVEDPRLARTVAERGRHAILERHSPQVRAPLLGARLAASRAAADDRGRAEPGRRPRPRWWYASRVERARAIARRVVSGPPASDGAHRVDEERRSTL